MTIPTQQSTQTFLGNGVTVAFDFSFVGDSSSDIVVMYQDTTGAITTLSPSQYTLFLNPASTGSLWGIGGTITYPTMGSPIADGTQLIVSRVLPLTQVITISNQGDFAPDVIEEALDTLEMQIQQVAGRTGQFRGTWITATIYNYGDYVIDGANGADTLNYYMCAIANTSSVWATDLSAGDWVIVSDFASIQQIEEFVAEAAASAAASATSATNSSNSATSSATSATNAANYAAALSATSTTSITIGTGAKVFTTQSGKQFITGQFLIIASNADDTNYMHGQVTTYSGTTLTMNITDISGSGAHTDWNISISGTQGPAGSVTSVSGTTNRITVTGPASDPVINISASYVGQDTITTIGTIAMGTVPAANVSGLGTAALVNTGVSTGQVPLMNGTGYPAANGSLITNLTPANISGLPFTKEYISSPQTITLGGQLTLSHGLGATPKLGASILTCITNDSPFTAGQEVMYNINGDLSSQSSAMNVIRNSSNIVVRLSSFGLGITNSTSGGSFTITPANWTITFLLWA